MANNDVPELPPAKTKDGSFRALMTVARVSWSLLTRSEKIFFSLRVLIRFALNALDIVAVALMGALGAVTASALSGQRLEVLGFQLPEPTPGNVVLLVSLVAVMFFVRGGLAILFQRWTAVFLAGVEIKNTAKVTRYLFSGSLSRMKGYSRADLSFLATTSTSAAFSGVLGSLTTLVIEATMFLSVFVVFLIVDWVAALAIAGYFALIVALMQLTTARRYLKSGLAMRESTVDSGNALLEMVDAYREVAVLSKQSFYLTRLIEAMKVNARTGVNLQILKSLPPYVAQGGLTLGAVGFIIWQLSKGDLQDGLVALGIFFAGSLRMMSAILPLQALWNELRVMQNWVTSAQEILVKLRDVPEELESDIFAPTDLIGGATHFDRPVEGLDVVVSDVYFSHVNSDSATLAGVNLHIAPGGFAALIGPSGAGKTTLVDVILGLHEPSSGFVTLNGLEPLALRTSQPGLMSYVPQKPGIVSGTIAQNVALGEYDDNINHDKVWGSLERAQLADVVRKLPDGIHSSLGPQSDALSGGQIQRLGLARALYTDPRFLILDEATSALDASTEASIAEHIRELGNSTTVLVIAHRLSTVQHADVVYVMDEGKIVGSGTFKDVRRSVPMIEEYVKLMSFDDK